jgi:hypothetical protein
MFHTKKTLQRAIKNTAQKLKWVAVCGVLLTAVGATSASAAPVVVGSVNPVTNRVTIFEDLMVKTFADGGIIQHFYGGYGNESGAYFLVRAGKTATGGCRTEVFRLVRISGNRVAIADPANPSIAWNPQIHVMMFATFDCTSPTCGFCETGNPNDPLGTSPQSGCACDQSSGSSGRCEKVKPGSLSYGAPQIVAP